MKKKVIINGNSDQVEFEFERLGSAEVNITYNEVAINGRKVIDGSSDQFDVINLDGRNFKVKRVGDYISIDGKNFKVESAISGLAKKSGGDGNMMSPMPGKILKVMVTVGEEVVEGQGLLVMEAMKMEHTIKAAHGGVVAAIHYKEGELVDGGVDLLDLEVAQSNESKDK